MVACVYPGCLKESAAECAECGNRYCTKHQWHDSHSQFEATPTSSYQESKPRSGTMGGVRTIAGIFGFLGWITLVIGAVGIVVVISQLGSNPNFSFAVVATSIAPLLLLALGPFTVWALLSSLCEIHAQGSELLQTMVRLEDVMRRSPR